jgi:methionyl-tRNA formyltransferase
MRLAYAGTAPFGALVLRELLVRRARVVVVLTRPDKPRGRHGTPQASAVKELALERGLPVVQPGRLDMDVVGRLKEHGADLLAVCAHGQIMPAVVLDAMPTLVVHPSAVPRWRGATPVERALMAGETELAVATLRMTPGLDEGPIGDLRRVHVPREADAGETYEALAAPAAESLLATVAAIEDGSVRWRPQEGEASYAAKLERDERTIDWTRPAEEIIDKVRALSPAIGARTELHGHELVIWRARALAATPDVPAPDRLVLPAGRGWVEVLELQAPGGRRLPTAAFLRGAGRWLRPR